MDKSEKQVTFVPSVDFRGWPNGYEADRKGVAFVAGVESLPVPQSYAELMREKGLVTDSKAKADAGEKSKA